MKMGKQEFRRHRASPLCVASVAFAVIVLLHLQAPPSLSASSPFLLSPEQNVLLGADPPVQSAGYPYAIDPTDAAARYFVYQPSGGWGNQRLILRWAMRAANNMERTLVLPMVGPHSMMWWGYDKLNASQMARADKVLDLDALNLGLVKGLRVHDGHLSELRKVLRGSWKVYTKPQTKEGKNGAQVPAWFSDNAIRYHWRKRSERVVFWQKGSMWMCCASGERMTPYIMFSRRLKTLAQKLGGHLIAGQYNAVHVRRADGHTRIDRRTAKLYMEMHLQPAGINTSLPLYVATDEKDASWFQHWTEQGFSLLFWKDIAADPVRQAWVSAELQNFPRDMHGDVVGFIEQLLCARAQTWTGSDGSTFSMAIQSMRKFPPLREIEWRAVVAQRPDLYSKIYAGDGVGQSEAGEEDGATKDDDRATED